MPDVLAYLSHSLGSANGDEAVRRGDNIANAGDWLRFLVETTTWAITMPWYPYVVTLREIHRPRAYVDQLRILKRCDALVLCGGLISSHMRDEIAHAKRSRVALVDVTDLGYRPPFGAPDARDVLDARLAAALEVARAAV